MGRCGGYWIVKVAVLGLWHLGCVTAAGAAEAGHEVVAWDPSRAVVASLAGGQPPVGEPGLADLVQRHIASGRLRFAADLAEAVGDREVVWIAFDTPVDDDDRANVDAVVAHVTPAWRALRAGTVVLSSSQLPVGTVQRMEAACASVRADRIGFASMPENLRLGRAIELFLKPDRVVIGTRTEEDREVLARLFAPITTEVVWMTVESAEMTKHAINAFLATSVTFINELAGLAERVGADAREVERGLRSESRIGPKAYLSPGGAFAGGTLARDIAFLREMGERLGHPTPFFDGVDASNRRHREWAIRRLRMELGPLRGKRIGIWGLTYKPGTNTLRRSPGVALAAALLAEGAVVRVYDPEAEPLPDRLAAQVARSDDAIEAIQGVSALVVSTEWPAFRMVDRVAMETAMPNGLILDANRFLSPVVAGSALLRIVAVGQPV